MQTRFILTWIAALIAINSCVHEIPLPGSPTGGGTGTGGSTSNSEPCDPDTVYFKNTILPLINSTCGKGGCHGTVNRGAFALTDYNQIVSRLGSTNRLHESLNDMADQTSENPGLNYTPPTAAQLTQLETWISQGSLNNGCNGCDTTVFTYSAAIVPILNTYCVGCHTGSSSGGGVDLSTYSAVKTVALNGQLLGSITWVSPYTGSKQMPQGGSKLSDCYLTQVRKWIDAGAQNN